MPYTSPPHTALAPPAVLVLAALLTPPALASYTTAATRHALGITTTHCLVPQLGLAQPSTAAVIACRTGDMLAAEVWYRVATQLPLIASLLVTVSVSTALTAGADTAVVSVSTAVSRGTVPVFLTQCTVLSWSSAHIAITVLPPGTVLIITTLLTSSLSGRTTAAA